MAPSIETFDNNDQLHVALASINRTKGKGELFGIARDKAGRQGVAITQRQYGLWSFEFRVSNDSGAWRVYARGLSRLIPSDYFGE